MRIEHGILLTSGSIGPNSELAPMTIALEAKHKRVPLLFAALATTTRKSNFRFRKRDIRLSVASVAPDHNTQLCFAVDGDTRSWGEMAVARVKARAKAKTKTPT